MVETRMLPALTGGTVKQIKYATQLREEHLAPLNKEVEKDRSVARSWQKRGDEQYYHWFMENARVREEVLLRALLERTDAIWWIENSPHPDQYGFGTVYPAIPASTRLLDEAKVVVDAIYTIEIAQTPEKSLQATPKSTAIIREVIRLYREEKTPMAEILGMDIRRLEEMEKEAPLYPLSRDYWLKYRDEYIHV